jgi:polyisoprenyl-phosphate glycosyltransferase
VKDSAISSLAIVVPLYRTRAEASVLLGQIRRSLAARFDRLEVIFVDDACPERSYEAVMQIKHVSAGLEVSVCVLDRNIGQHAALIVGLQAQTSGLVALMDGDLQDTPDGLVALLERFDAASATGCPPDAVVAARRGNYETPGRRRTGRLVRSVVHAQTRGRIPRDAGSFLVMTRNACERVLALGDPCVHVVAALGRVGAKVESVPITRLPRSGGTSSYTRCARIRLALGVLVVNTPAYRVVLPLRRSRARRGNVGCTRLVLEAT